MTAFYTVVHDRGDGRLTQCHKHPTLEEARECARTLHLPQGIIGWVQDARPQFTKHPLTPEGV